MLYMRRKCSGLYMLLKVGYAYQRIMYNLYPLVCTSTSVNDIMLFNTTFVAYQQHLSSNNHGMGSIPPTHKRIEASTH